MANKDPDSNTGNYGYTLLVDLNIYRNEIYDLYNINHIFRTTFHLIHDSVEFGSGIVLMNMGGSPPEVETENRVRVVLGLYSEQCSCHDFALSTIITPKPCRF